jgi:hypothetical protein
MTATVEKLVWRDIPLDEIAMPKQPLRLTLGLGSGLCARDGRIFAVTDRGPNLHMSQAIDDYGLAHLEHLRGIKDAKVMPLPDDGPEVAELAVAGDTVSLVRRIVLRTRSGARLSGRALPDDGLDRGEMEEVYGLDGGRLAASVLGADTEAITVLPDGSFFVAEEYGPSLLKVDAAGVVSERWMPRGHDARVMHGEVSATGALPAQAAQRRLNRGIEALCASGDGRRLYLCLQSPIAGADKHSLPFWKLDAETGALLGEWSYPLDDPSTFARDAVRRKVGWKDLKVCEFAWAGEDRLVVLERIAHSAKFYLFDLARGAKRLLASSDDHPEIGPDIEGMALLSPKELLICSDNDFGVEGAETGFWRIRLGEALA